MRAPHRWILRIARPLAVGALAALAAFAPRAAAKGRASVGQDARTSPAPKPWCAPEVHELSDHVCWFDGGPQPDTGRRTLVIYLHGSLAPTPGFQYLQQRGMAIHAKRQHFTVLIPTSPNIDGYYVWPTGRAAQQAHEAEVLAGIREARAKLEKTMNVHFDETFVVGFSSGAYYGSSLAMRGLLDVDGYIVLAGGSSWARPGPDGEAKRAPVFVGVSASDKQTAEHSRALARTLASMRWPYRAEERNVGHMVDWGFMDHGMAWLRARARAHALEATN